MKGNDLWSVVEFGTVDKRVSKGLKLGGGGNLRLASEQALHLGESREVT